MFSSTPNDVSASRRWKATAAVRRDAGFHSIQQAGKPETLIAARTASHYSAKSNCFLGDDGSNYRLHFRRWLAAAAARSLISPSPALQALSTVAALATLECLLVAAFYAAVDLKMMPVPICDIHRVEIWSHSAAVVAFLRRSTEQRLLKYFFLW